jgi:3',5'-cyclic-AMP phosphodiesterase
MLKFVHLTDTHLVAPGQALYGLDPQWRLSQAVRSIITDFGDADFVIVTGDLTHWGEASAYEALRHELARLPMPAHLLIGNHDDRLTFLRVFDGRPTTQDGHVQFAFSAHGIRHVALDSNEPGVEWGAVCERRAQWLANELDHCRDLPVHLFVHHPPFPTGIPTMDRIAIREAGPLRAALMPHRDRIRHIFFGHLHRPLAGSWLGVPFSSVRGTNHQVAMNLRDTERIPGSHEPPQFAVVLADEERTVVHLHDFADQSRRFDL